MLSIKRPLLRYLGGKYRLSDWIISQFPSHYLYCEPFGGGGSVLCQKPCSPVEVYNDLDNRLVNFFQVLRSQPAELIRQIELTPYSRAEYELSATKSGDPIEDARRLYVASWQSRGGGYVAGGNRGWRYQNRNWSGVNVVSQWHRTEDLWAFAQRLRTVQIECDDALSIITRYDSPETLFYADPPYLAETRSNSHKFEYFCEMNPKQHSDLAVLLHSIKGMCVLSGYRSPLYDELFSEWHCIEKAVQTQARTEAVECLWISPNCYAEQMPLFQKRCDDE